MRVNATPVDELTECRGDEFQRLLDFSPVPDPFYPAGGIRRGVPVGIPRRVVGGSPDGRNADGEKRGAGSQTIYALGGDERTRTADPLLAKQVLYQLSYVPRGMQETWQKTRPGSSIRRTSSLPSARSRRNRAAAPAMRHQGVLEEGVSRIGVDYAAVLTASRARCLASVREFTISAKPSRSAVWRRRPSLCARFR
jgi:hypothetical protein